MIKSCVSKITGKSFSTLALLIAKSGAHLQLDPNPAMSTTGQELCKLSIVGMPQNVALAGQLIQEVRACMHAWSSYNGLHATYSITDCMS